MSSIENLHPHLLWKYFLEICEIPRPSKKEEKITAYLLEFAQKQGLEARRDEIGNVVIFKSATPGKENVKPVVLQSHTDMVCEKHSNVEHNFDTDPIIPRIEDGWVKANGTTLGADDGIGIASQLAILASNDIEHGPIECIFTVDEETGLTGAFEMKPGFFTGKTLLNLDSEDEGELFIGCAGGVDTLATFVYDKRPVPSGYVAFRMEVKGLLGGHSGDDIHKGHGNSIKILNRFLWKSNMKYDICLSEIGGGNLRNAIPRESKALFTIDPSYVQSLKADFKEFAQEVKDELALTDSGVVLTLEEAALPETAICESVQFDLLNALYSCPNGVIAMSFEMPGLVETSTNLASVKMEDADKIVVTTSQRSSVNSAKVDISQMVESVFRLANASVVHSDGYPGWKPNTNSEILRITEKAYKKLFGEKPIVRAIHAGLECGLFLEKYPELDMISFGPTIRGAHSPEERLDIQSTQKYWDLLLEVLREVK
jgi:dipeptidase D